ncbi:MAG: SDR family oxidoreductase [Caldilineaceae bacterium]|nr:SDR family oxidoreductase [Caldilineaceae bacterium]
MNHSTIQQWYDFSGKTALITGGTGVLCGEMAAALAGLGANVAILARRAQVSPELQAKLEAATGETMLVQGDVLDRVALESAVGRVIARYGRIDILINGAGGNHPDANAAGEKTFFDLPKEALEFVFDLNIMGTFLTSQVVGKIMAEQGEGVILNLSSMAAFTPLTRVVGYAAAKAGVNNFTYWLATYMAREFSPRIRVNALAPGFFIGNQNRALLLNEDGSLTERGRLIIDHTPMGRFGEPDELLGAMLWLLSPGSQFVTGIIVPVDGGYAAFGGV